MKIVLEAFRFISHKNTSFNYSPQTVTQVYGLRSLIHRLLKYDLDIMTTWNLIVTPAPTPCLQDYMLEYFTELLKGEGTSVERSEHRSRLESE